MVITTALPSRKPALIGAMVDANEPPAMPEDLKAQSRGLAGSGRNGAFEQARNAARRDAEIAEAGPSR